MKNIFKKSKRKDKKVVGKKKSLNKRLIRLVVILIFSTVLLVGVSSYLVSVNSLEEELKNSSSQLTQEIKNGVSEYFLNYEKGINVISKNEAFTDLEEELSEEEVNNINKALGDYYNSNDEILSIYFAPTVGGFYDFPQTDLGEDESYIPTTRPWYSLAEENKKTIWNDPYLDVDTKETIVTISVPSYNGDDLKGVIAIDLSSKVLADRLGKIKGEDEGELILVDGNNIVISHPNIDLVGEELPIEEVNTATAKKESGIVEYSMEENGKEEDKFTTFSTIGGLNWKVLNTTYMSEIREEANKILFYNLVIAIFVLTIAIAAALYYSKKITKPINLLVKDMEKVKEGDFTVKSNIITNDEIATLSETFNIMVGEVKHLINNSREASMSVISSSQELAATSEETSAQAEEVSRTVEEIAKGASEQASDAENGASLVAGLGERINELVINSEQIINDTKSVMDLNIAGVSAVESLKEENKENKLTTDNIEKAVTGLNDKSKNIGEILGTITSIAEQTNLLALNASIEAARAGDAGRGFAVVANEIRSLAEGSGIAAEKIRDIILGLQNESKNTVDAMRDVKSSAEKQDNAVEKVNNSFSNISNKIDDISAKIENMNEYIKTIEESKNGLVDSIQNISSVSEETAAASEEVSASMQEQTSAVEQVAMLANNLSALSDKLNSEIERFKI
ncbi:MAG: methyl-accepting chemotaxis protein [Senegalia sp. (in: firmicutes)]